MANPYDQFAAPEEEEELNPYSQFKAEPQTKPEKEEEWAIEDFAEGIGVSGLSTYYGIKELFTDLDDEDIATLADWKEDAAESGWGTFGEIVGDVGQLFMPAGAVTKTLSGASKMVKAGSKLQKTLSKSASPLIADVVASGALEMVKLPDEGESRLKNFAKGAGGAAFGGVLGKTISKMTKGVDITDYAKKIFDAGGDLTMGKAAKSKFLQGVETVSEVVPFLSRGVQKAQERNADIYTDIIMQRAAPKGFKIVGSGTEGMTQLKKAYSDAYTEAWKGADSVNAAGKLKFKRDAIETYKYVDEVQQRKIKKIAAQFNRAVTDPDERKIRAFDNMIRKEIKKVKFDDIEMKEGLTNMRQAFRDGIPSGTADKIREVDKGYGKYLTVKKAVSKAAEEGGEFTPKQLVSAGRTVGGETLTSLGKAPVQELAVAGAQTIGKKVGGQPLDFFRRVAKFAPSLYPAQGVSNLVMGRTGIQKSIEKGKSAIDDIVRGSKYGDQLRKFTPAKLGGQYLNSMDVQEDEY